MFKTIDMFNCTKKFRQKTFDFTHKMSLQGIFRLEAEKAIEITIAIIKINTLECF